MKSNRGRKACNTDVVAGLVDILIVSNAGIRHKDGAEALKKTYKSYTSTLYALRGANRTLYCQKTLAVARAVYRDMKKVDREARLDKLMGKRTKKAAYTSRPEPGSITIVPSVTPVVKEYNIIQKIAKALFRI